MNLLRSTLGLLCLGSIVAAKFTFKEYTVTLNIDDEKESFTGKVEMLVYYEGDGTDSNITLNNAGLTWSKTNTTVWTKDHFKEVEKVVRNGTSQMAVIFVRSPFENGQDHKITINYSGWFHSADKEGLFKQTYNTKSEVIATNFFPSFARKVFPCLDDPSSRATYTLTINHNGGWDVYSFGTPTIKTEKQSKFGPSPPLAPSNVGFFMVKNYLTLTRDSNRINLIYPTGMVPPTYNYVLWPSLNLSLGPFSEMLQASGLKSLTIVGVPSLPLEMVNYYGIVYVQAKMLTINELSSIETINFSMDLLGAIAQQFYGTVLGPSSWADLLIYKSVAIFIQYQILGKMTDTWDRKLLEQWNSTLRLNALQSEQNVLKTIDNTTTPSDIIRFVNDPAAYKGAAILKMIEASNDEYKKPGKTMQGALLDFFKKNIFKAVDTYTLFDYLTANATDQRVWLTNQGYPLVSVSSGSSLQVSQDFVNPNILESKNEAPTAWPIPIDYEYNSTSEGWYTLNKSFNTSDSISWSGESPPLINLDSVGVYRTVYDSQASPIIWNIQGSLGPALRSQLIDDALTLGILGKGQSKLLLNQTNYLREETDFMPWKMALNGLRNYINLYYDDTELVGAIQDKIIYFMEPITGSMEWKMNITSDFNGNLVRAEIADAACEFLSDTCAAKEAAKNMSKMTHPETYYGVDLLDVIKCYDMKTITTSDQWQTKFEAYYNPSDSPSTRRRALKILACISCPNCLVLYFKRIAGQKFIIKEDTQAAMAAIYNRPEHVSPTITYIFKNYDVWKKLKNDFPRILEGIGPKLSTDDHKSQLEGIINKTNDDKELLKVCESVKAKLLETMDIKKASRDDVAAWAKVKPSPPITSTSSGPPAPTTSGPNPPDNSTTTTQAPTTTSKKPGAGVMEKASFSLLVFLLSALIFSR